MSETTTEAAADAMTETAGEKSADTTAEVTNAETTTATAAAEKVDWQAKFEAQQKVTRDLERKVKGEAGSLKTQLDALQAKLDGKEAEHQAAQEAQKVRDEALNAANERILKAEVRAAAAAKLADPQDALRFLDLSEFEVGSGGEVDASQVAKAIDDLIASKPYLAAQGGQRFQGGADGGARNGSAQPAQLTQQDVKRLAAEGKHEEINKAREAGQLNELLGIKP